MIGQNIKHLREYLGISQEELAHRTGVHSNTVARWERDEVSPRGLSMAKLANALQVSPAELLNGEINNLEQEPTFIPALSEKHSVIIEPQTKTGDRGMLTYELNGQKLQVPATPEYAPQFWARVDRLIGLQPAASPA